MGRKEHCKQISLACVGIAHSVSATLGLPPLMVFVLFQSTLLRLQAALQGVGPGLYALPRSKPLRFRFSGTLQRCGLGWACVLCPSQILAAQATRCLVSAVSPRWGAHRISSPIPATRFSGWLRARPSQVCYVSLLGSYSLAATLPVDVNHPESQELLVSNRACLQFSRGCLSGAEFAPFCLWLPPTCLTLVGDGPVCSLLSPLFCERAW